MDVSEIIACLLIVAGVILTCPIILLAIYWTHNPYRRRWRKRERK